jgi:O-antigen ligase
MSAQKVDTRPTGDVLAWSLNVSAFVFFALSLAVPSGYSYGAMALALLAVASCWREHPRAPAGRETKILLWSLCLAGLLWGLAFKHFGSSAGLAYGAKYALAALCLWLLSPRGLASGAVVWGVAVGAAGALSVAVYQSLALHLDRATGFTNAIQFGDIAMYLGIAAWALALLGRWRWPQGIALGLCGICGVLAALLSGSRGGWVTAPFLLAALWLMAARNGHGRRAAVALAALLIGGAALALALPAREHQLGQRADLAVEQAQHYLTQPNKYARTSIGQRLEQWRLAARLIAERPMTGWGPDGYVQAKQAQVNRGLADPSVMNFGHAHNEILDMWAKRGLGGLAILLFFYAAPLYAFWPTPSRLTRVDVARRPRLLALRAVATLLPLAYFGFGWTQVFFAHNSGHMFYIFSLGIFWSAICLLEKSGSMGQITHDHAPIRVI